MLRNSSRLRNLRHVTRSMVTITNSTLPKVQPTTFINQTRLYATQQKKVIPYTVERLSGFVRDDKYKKVE